MKLIKDKRQAALLGILIIVLIYYFFDNGLFSGGGIKSPIKIFPTKTSGDENLADLDDIHQIIDLAAVMEVHWEGDWEGDPFFYISPESLSNGSKGGLINDLFGTVNKAANISNISLSLTGISRSGNSAFAIINGQPVKIDDTIGGYRIEKIAADHVILKQGSKTLRLTLND